MKNIVEDTMFSGRVIFRNLPVESVATLPDSTTPSVSQCEVFLGSGIVVTISNFLDGSDGQHIRILGDGTTTIANNTHIVTNTGANKLLTANKIYRFTYFNSKLKWYEDS